VAISELNGAVEELALWGASLDPCRNVREITKQSLDTGFMRVKGVLRDDSNIAADPRARVHPIPFSVVVPEKVSLKDLQIVIFGQTRPLA
jgi:hypothetical protein